MKSRMAPDGSRHTYYAVEVYIIYTPTTYVICLHTHTPQPIPMNAVGSSKGRPHMPSPVDYQSQYPTRVYCRRTTWATPSLYSYYKHYLHTYTRRLSRVGVGWVESCGVGIIWTRPGEHLFALLSLLSFHGIGRLGEMSHSLFSNRVDGGRGVAIYTLTVCYGSCWRVGLC